MVIPHWLNSVSAVKSHPSCSGSIRSQTAAICRAYSQIQKILQIFLSFFCFCSYNANTFLPRKMKRNLPLFENTKARAFTLIEVMMSVTIVAVVVLPITGLLALAMDASGDAFSQTTRARIASQLVGEIQQAQWRKIDDWKNEVRYFDEMGARVKAGNDDFLFTAKVFYPDIKLITSEESNNGAFRRQIVVIVSARPGQDGEREADDAWSAIQNGKKVIQDIHIARALVTKLEK